MLAYPFSRLVELLHMRIINSAAVITVLRSLVSTFRVTEKLVTDSDQFFVSAVTDFFRNNGVRHFPSAPYHRTTNEQVVRMVNELMEASAKCPSAHLECRLLTSLFKQQTTVNTTRGKKPARLVFGREVPAPLSRLVSTQSPLPQETCDPGSKEIRPLQDVLVYNFPGNKQCVLRRLLETVGSRSCLIQTGLLNLMKRTDHIRQAVKGAF